ncbi:MAG: VirB4 family type IV secretion system protein [Thermoplasmata archaeon]
MKILKDRIETENSKISYFSMDLPSRINFGELSDILTDEPHCFRMDIKSISDSFSVKMLESETQRMFLNIRSKKSSVNIKTKNRLSSAKSLLEYIISGHGHLYDVKFTIYVKNIDDDSNDKKVLGKYKSKNFRISKDKFNLKKNHLSIIMPPDNSEGKKLHTHGISMLFPFPGKGLMMENGILLGFHYFNNSPVIFNRWAFPASHGIITGSTGYGKSHFVKMFIMREKLADEKTKYFIIDPLGEYRGISRFLNMEYSNLSGNSIPDILLRIENESKDEYVERIASLFSSILHLNDRERIYLSKSIRNCNTCNKESLLKAISGKELIAKNLKLYVSDFFETPGGKFLMGNKKIPEDGIHFDLSRIKDSDYDISIKVILNGLIPVLRNENKKIFVLDEAWKLMKDQDNLSIMDTLFRHVRRYKTSINLITQKSDDLLLNEKGRSMMHNSLFHIIFRHTEVTDDMEKFYSLNKKEIKYIENMKGADENGSQAFMISQHIRIPMKVPLTDYERKIMEKDEI